MSLYVLGVSPWLGAERGGMRVAVAIPYVCACLYICVSWRRRTGKRNRTNRERATETPESLIFHLRLIIN